MQRYHEERSARSKGAGLSILDFSGVGGGGMRVFRPRNPLFPDFRGFEQFWAGFRAILGISNTCGDEFCQPNCLQTEQHDVYAA